MLRRLQLNLTQKFVAFVFLISVLPLLTVGISSYQAAKAILEQEELEDVRLLNRQKTAFFDLQFQQLQSIINAVANVHDILEALSVDQTASSTFNQLATNAKIGYILDGYAGLDGLTSIDIFTLTDKHYHVGDTLNTSDIRTEVRDRLWQEVLQADHQVVWHGVEANVNASSASAQVLTLAKLLRKTDPDSLQSNPLGMLLVNYDLEYLQQQIDQNLGDTQTQVLLIDSKFDIVYSSMAEQIGQPVSAEFLDQLSNQSGDFRVQIEGQEMLVAYQYSDLCDWIVVTLSPLDTVLGQIGIIQAVILLALVAAFTVVAIGVFVVSWRVVYPLRQITSRFKLLQRQPQLATQPLLVEAEGEVADLILCFNTFLDSLVARQQTEHTLRQTTQDLEVAIQQANAANHAKTQFLMHMSHELRTPLNAVLGFTDLLKQSMHQSDRDREHLQIVSRSGKHLLDLINDILEMSKIEAGNVQVQHTLFNLHTLLSSLQEILSLKASQKGLALSFRPSRILPQYILGDERKLRQVLLNLISNGIKFTEQGQVSLRAYTKATASDQQQLVIEVEDTGCGIDLNDFEQLAQPFGYRTPLNRTQEGTGLGLAISQNLIQLLGGTITVESQLGQGSCFTVMLPLELPREASSAIKPASDDLQQGTAVAQPEQYRILVAEDVETNWQLLTRLLTALGYQVRVVHDGEASINMAAAWHPHIILMDMQMPVLDGYQATRQIKATPLGQQTPIIAVTSSSFEGDRHAAFRAGCDDIIHKPVQRPQLLAALKQFLEPASFPPPLPITVEQRSLNHQSLRDLLQAMPNDWRTNLHYAAVSCSSEDALALVQQLPEDTAGARQQLIQLAEKFQFMEIAHLLEELGEEFGVAPIAAQVEA